MLCNTLAKVLTLVMKLVVLNLEVPCTHCCAVRFWFEMWNQVKDPAMVRLGLIRWPTCGRTPVAVCAAWGAGYKAG